MSTLSDRIDTVTNMTVTEWCDRHGLIHELTPFASRTSDRIDVVRQLHESIEALPETASTFVPRKELEGDVGHGGWLETVVLMTGAWPHPEHDRRWVNPNYIHLDALPPLEVDREDHLRRCAALGVLRIEDLAPRFGVTTGSLRTWISRKDIDWRQRRTEGCRQFARTLQTAIKWGHTESEITGCWPRKRGTVRAQIQKFARDEGFAAPPDPSTDSAFLAGDQR